MLQELVSWVNKQAPDAKVEEEIEQMAFMLPELPYSFDALEPHIDARTMEIHHGKHHAGYVKNVNAALESSPDLQGKSIEELLADLNAVPQEIRTVVRNNGGGHANHSQFWPAMSPDGSGEPDGALASAIDAAFGGFAAFQDAFSSAAASRFGSGWGWLALDGSKELKVLSTPNQDSPITDGLTPLLGLDVWEHAYYLHYQNRRADYIAAWWNVVNWSEVAERFKAAMG
jgi:Fe-Mn family superoxide dismutase